jgi:hypothetical protein
MAQLIGRIDAVVGSTTDIHLTAQNVLGSRAEDKNGNEYIYLQGIASTVANDAVTYSPAFLTTRVAAAGVGPVAIAQAAVLASQFGWYLIRGFGSVNTKTSIAAAKSAFLTVTAGQVDDASVAGDQVNGMLFTGVDVSLVAPVHVNYPQVTATVPA